MVSFNTLPTEVKDMIYELVLVSDHPIPICSPPRQKYAKVDEIVARTIEKTGIRYFRFPGPGPVCPFPPDENGNDYALLVTKSFRPRIDGFSFVSADFASLSLVCKEIQAEIGAIFFARNTFLVGNGPHGSSKRANLHGLRSFLRNASLKSVESIRKVEVLLSERKVTEMERTDWSTYWYRYRADSFWIETWGYSHLKHPKDLQSLNRIVAKSFKGLEAVDLTYAEDKIRRPTVAHAYMHGNATQPWMSEACVRPMERAMKVFLNHPSIKMIRIREDDAHMSERIRIILEGMESSVKVEELHPGK